MLGTVCLPVAPVKAVLPVKPVMPVSPVKLVAPVKPATVGGVFCHAHVMQFRIAHAAQMRCRMRTSVAGETSEAGEAGGTRGTCETGVSSIACTQKPIVTHRSACISTRPANA